MCGIFGYRIFSKPVVVNPKTFDVEEFTEKNIRGAFSKCEDRGKEAAGIWTRSGRLRDGISGSFFFRNNADKIMSGVKDTDILIAHCRASTWGRKSDAPAVNNENNHPFESDRYVLVHNGVLRDCPPIKGYKYRGDCDTELALSYVDTFGVEKAMRYMCKQDKFAFVILDKYENELYFIRHENPLCYSYDTSRNAILFGSTSEILWELQEEEVINGMVMVSGSVPILLTSDVLFKVTDTALEAVTEKLQFAFGRYFYKNLPEAEREVFDLEEFFPKVETMGVGSSYSPEHNKGMGDMFMLPLVYIRDGMIFYHKPIVKAAFADDLFELMAGMD